uniref:Peptidase S1 domain-containing protein n=1 Tax=Periophthalmus magnuspinnatus TaxID=409849 RepID=A0A3B4AU86_9GOBI
SDAVLCDNLAGLRSFLPETEEETRIIGGEEALFHSWPWQVSLTFITMPACGGAILSPFWVLSAAHCFRRCNSIQVLVVCKLLAGNVHYSSLKFQMKVVAVSIILIHKDYSTQTKEYDIALLKLKEPLIFNDFVRPINIWMTTLPLFTECTTTGWGSTRENGPRVNKLQEVNVTLLPSEVCNKYYVGRILDTMFCAGKEEGGADACQGDSGGPISCFNGSRYELAGVVSWGVGCGRAKKPGVYTRIQNNMSVFPAEDNCGKHRGRGCVTVPLTASLHQSQDGVTSVQNISESCPFYWPWQVSIQQDGHHYCSGTLISQQFVITAQHCNVRVEDTVVLGLHDIRYSLLQRIPVVRVINLPQDGSFPPGSDLSLIQLATPTRLGTDPIQNKSDGDLDHSWICTVTGWGTTKATGGVNPNRLHHAVVTLFNQTTCREKWGEDMIKDSHLCAHPAASTSCLGDSGAPLFCRKHGAYFLFGIVTWGSSRCDEHFPAVFTRVPRFYSWISDEIGDQGGLQ